jgi:hypothetical protein
MHLREFIARENIKRFEAQLATCIDDDQRQIIQGLLDAELRVLAEIVDGKAPAPNPNLPGQTGA